MTTPPGRFAACRATATVTESATIVPRATVSLFLIIASQSSRASRHLLHTIGSDGHATPTGPDRSGAPDRRVPRRRAKGGAGARHRSAGGGDAEMARQARDRLPSRL